MSWTNGIRRRALLLRRELGLSLEEAFDADRVLAALENKTGLRRCALPLGDARLGGAAAVLSLPTKMIFQDHSRSETARRFDAAHVYAHALLHRGGLQCAAGDLDGGDLRGTPPAGQDKVDGHSLSTRREAEANIFAAEMLLPGPLLRRLFFAQGWAAPQVAEALGLTPALVEAQMLECLPPPPPAPEAQALETSTPTPAAQSFDLDPSQRQAAEVPHGPLLLGAGPGTGKTKTLVGRCEYLVREGVPPEKILCLTFSRDAAQEMRERLAGAGVGTNGTGPWVGTFHGFGLELLRRYGARIGIAPDIKLMGGMDRITLLENNLPALGLDVLDVPSDPAFHLRGILRQISRAQDELCPPERYMALCAEMSARAGTALDEFLARPGKKLKKDQEPLEKAVIRADRAVEVARCYAIYEQLKAADGLLDFGDLVRRPVELLQQCPEALAAMHDEFHHVLADEYQDVNRAGAALVRLIARDAGRGLWAVGDHRQSIYRFRGASPANVAAFQADYPQGRRLELGVNYRSHTPIVDCFGAVAGAMMPVQADFGGWTAQRGPSGDAACVTLAVAPDEEGQAAGLAAAIREMRPRHSYGQLAILCRTNAQAQALAGQLTALGVPVLYLGDLMERSEVKDLLCLLTLFTDSNGLGLLRVGALPDYAIPQPDILTFLDHVREARLTCFEALMDPAAGQGLSDAAQAGFRRLARDLTALQALPDDPAARLRHYLFTLSGFLRPSAQTEEETFAHTLRLLAVRELYGLALSFQRRVVAPAAPSGPPGTTREFLAHLQRLSAAGENPKGAMPEGAEELDGVNILTAHRAKGLEYPVVYVPNLTDGAFPTSNRADAIPEPPGLADAAADETDEELCLFFVALSRARDRLMLSYATSDGNGKPREPSSLLASLTPWLDAQAPARVTWPSGRSASTNDPATVPPEGESPLFTAWALETYERCPRRYHYQYVLRLPGLSIASGYRQSQACVRRVLEWADEARVAGRELDESELASQFGKVWAADGPVGHLHEQRYRDSAEQMLRAWRALNEGREALDRHSLIATLAGCRVSVRPDIVQRRPGDGARVLARRLLRAPRSGDRTDKTPALMRRAAEETYPGERIVIELQSLEDGSRDDVGPPATEKKAEEEARRLRKFEEAAEGIRLRLFPAKPNQATECATCAYALVCPV